MQFGYDVRPSPWQTIRSNAHLVIAAVGTVALVGVTGSALWLAMPDGERHAFAQPEKPAPAAAVQTADAQPAVNAGQLAGGSETAQAAAGGSSDGSNSATLSARDPRWKGAAPKQAAENKGAVELQKEAGAPPVPTPEQAAAVAAYQSVMDSPDGEKAKSHAGPDKAATAAIPTPKPTPPKAGGTDDGNGHILRAVTMRSGPKTSASAITTIPAKTAVQVMSCKSWCEIEYNGQRGWIYKSFLQRG